MDRKRLSPHKSHLVLILREDVVSNSNQIITLTIEVLLLQIIDVLDSCSYAIQDYNMGLISYIHTEQVSLDTITNALVHLYIELRQSICNYK